MNRIAIEIKDGIVNMIDDGSLEGVELVVVDRDIEPSNFYETEIKKVSGGVAWVYLPSRSIDASLVDDAFDKM
jgi:hypothetical protein